MLNTVKGLCTSVIYDNEWRIVGGSITRIKLRYDSRRAWWWCGRYRDCGKLVSEDHGCEAFRETLGGVVSGWVLHGGDSLA